VKQPCMIRVFCCENTSTLARSRDCL